MGAPTWPPSPPAFGSGPAKPCRSSKRPLLYAARRSVTTSCHHSSLERVSRPRSSSRVCWNFGSACQASQSARVCHVRRFHPRLHRRVPLRLAAFTERHARDDRHHRPRPPLRPRAALVVLRRRRRPADRPLLLSAVLLPRADVRRPPAAERVVRRAVARFFLPPERLAMSDTSLCPRLQIQRLRVTSGRSGRAR
jgi:hypothetical protein